jgi:hypothetical protein
LVPDTPILTPVTTTATLPKLPNTSQPATRVRTYQRYKKQFKSGNELHKYLKESCRYTQQQQETLNATAVLKASLDQITALEGLQGHILSTIEPIFIQPNSLEPSNRASNAVPHANKSWLNLLLIAFL